MPDYIFIKGKNPLLSSAELSVCMKNGRLADSTERFDVYETDNPPRAAWLGGTLKIGLVKTILPAGAQLDEIEKEVVKIIPEKLQKKLLFGASVYSKKIPAYRAHRAVGMAVKRALRLAGTKATFMGFPKARKEPQLTNMEVIKRKLVSEGFELLVCESEKAIYLSLTTDIHDPLEFQRRDVGRPVQRVIYSMPPRLARIMVNIALAPQAGPTSMKVGQPVALAPQAGPTQPVACAGTGKILLDPFCGIGTILQEAALAGADIRGTDIDPAAIEGCITNLRWLESEKNLKLGALDEKIRCWDAARLTELLEREGIDAIATEPYLGPPLRKKPKREEAQKLISELTKFYMKVFPAMREVLKSGSRMVIVLPSIRTMEGANVSVDIKLLADKNGFELLGTYMDAEPRHMIMRMVTVIKKPCTTMH